MPRSVCQAKHIFPRKKHNNHYARNDHHLKMIQKGIAFPHPRAEGMLKDTCKDFINIF
jgi:hypothetical protein